jgi:cell division transport system permease protein
MSSNIKDILSLYNQDFALAGLDFSTLTGMLGISVFMGLAGSAISVSRYVRQIEPK